MIQMRLYRPNEHNCGNLQMPDYYLSTMYSDAGPDTPASTYHFNPADAPQAIFINLGTNDMRVLRAGGIWPDVFINTTVEFMLNATKLWQKDDMHFFLSTGPHTNDNYVARLIAILHGRSNGECHNDMDPECSGKGYSLESQSYLGRPAWGLCGGDRDVGL